MMGIIKQNKAKKENSLNKFKKRTENLIIESIIQEGEERKFLALASVEVSNDM